MSAGRIDLSWDAVAAPVRCAVTYSVFRSTDAGFTPSEANRVAEGLTATEYADEGLVGSTTYYYVVQAVDEAGAAGATASAITPAEACAAAPAAPGSLTATAASATRIDLSWAAGTPPANCTVTYSVYRSASAGFTPGPANRIAQGLTVTEYADEGLVGSTTYYYVVQAVDEVGDASATASGTTQAHVCETPPSAPSSVTATAASATRIDLSWAAVTPPAHCTVTYSVYRSTSPGFTPGPSNRIAQGLTATAYADQGLLGSTAYYYVVQAVDGAGAAGATASATTQAYVCEAAPSSPGSLTATAASPSRIDLSWAAVSPPPHCAVTYRIFRSTSSGFTPGPANRIAQGLTVTAYADEGLHDARTYYYVVEAVDAAGAAGASTSATTPLGVCGSAPGTPGSLSAVAASGSRIDLSWSAVTAPPYCSVTYSIYRSTVAGFTPSASTRVASGVTATTFADRGLVASSTYYYVAQAVDAAGAGPATAAASATTAADACPFDDGASWIGFAGRRSGGDAIDIYLVHQDGSCLRRVISTPGEDVYPVFLSTDALGYSRDATGGAGIYVYDLVGGTGDSIGLTWDGAPTAPSFSTDGVFLAFEGTASGESRSDIYVTLATGGDVMPLTFAGNNSAPVFSPDGAYIYFVSDGLIYSMDAWGEARTALGGTNGVLGRPAISPDGTRLAYARSVSGGSEIVVRTLDTGAQVVISAHNDTSPAFDTTGTRLAVTSTRGGQPAIWMIDAADGANPVQVTFPIGVEIDGQPVFRP